MLDDISQDEDRLAARLSTREPVFWTNPALVRSHNSGTYRNDIADTQGRLRGAGYHLQVAFSGIGRSDVVESPLVAAEDLAKRWNVNAEDFLSIAGSTKVREEISGSVLSATEIEEEAIKVENNTNCGLASQLYIDNLTSATELLSQEPCPSNAFLRATSPCCSAATRNLVSRVREKGLAAHDQYSEQRRFGSGFVDPFAQFLKAHVPWKQKDRPPYTGHSTRRPV
ncbi:hypothetical protein [Mesorhizobium erdmanii]|uniref:hypothetical protein n=1 Tax=Mesorhizobium erdmanii TaxID=1777866 RepID=UPI00047DEBD8|nr:hypothetical protein [Mesorhizobium erdmanii]